MRYSQDVLQELASKVDLYEYAKNTVEFTKDSGNVHYCECIFHDEKTPSLAFFEESNTYHCFGCGAHGNIFNWLMATEGLTFMQAVEKVAGINGLGLQDCIESESMSIYKELQKSKKNISKSEKSVERTILSPDKDYFSKYNKEYPQEWLGEGITKEAMDAYEIMIDPAANRIIYPVYDNDFNMIGIKGRTRYENFKDMGIAKYMNYNKIGMVDYLTGMKQAIETVQSTGEIIVFEGIKSCMKLMSWDINNSVSAETCELNPFQFNQLLKMRIKTVVLAFDKGVSIDKYRKMCKKYRSYFNLYAIIDAHNLLEDKMSPADAGKEIWEELYSQKVRI